MYANVTVQVDDDDTLAKNTAEALAKDVLKALGGKPPPNGTDICNVQITMSGSTAPLPMLSPAPPVPEQLPA